MSGEITQGRRLPDGWHLQDAEPGDYWRQVYALRTDPDALRIDAAGRGVDWQWNVRDPAGEPGALGPGHLVTEHDDRTITVSPSIDSSPRVWHGYLTAGVWRSV